MSCLASSRRAASRAETKPEPTNTVIRNGINIFLKDCKTRPEMINQLSEYLKYRPQWEEPRDLLPVDELEQRLGPAGKFQTWKRTKLVEKAKKANPDDDEAQKQAMGWNLNRLAYAASTNRSVEIEPKDSNLRPYASAEVTLTETTTFVVGSQVNGKWQGKDSCLISENQDPESKWSLDSNTCLDLWQQSFLLSRKTRIARASRVSFSLVTHR
ncbi:hypothetical protein V2G26_021015 [Clonostachys chloroleuca]